MNRNLYDVNFFSTYMYQGNEKAHAYCSITSDICKGYLLYCTRLIAVERECGSLECVLKESEMLMCMLINAHALRI